MKFPPQGLPLALIGRSIEERRKNLKEYFADLNINVDTWPEQQRYTTQTGAIAATIDPKDVVLLLLVCPCGERHKYYSFDEIPMVDTICSGCHKEWIILCFNTLEKMESEHGYKTLWDHLRDEP